MTEQSKHGHSNEHKLHPEMGEAMDDQFDFDREWFAAHPGSKAMMRRPLAGEIEILSLASDGIQPIRDSAPVIIVVQFIPGARARQIGYLACLQTQTPVLLPKVVPPLGIGVPLPDEFFERAVELIPHLKPLKPRQRKPYSGFGRK